MEQQKLINKPKKRETNIEILRIIAILLIIAHHFSVHGEFNFSMSEISVNRLWIQFIQIGGKIGVDIFVLISGYFLINAKQTKINKILKLWIQIFIYSIGIFLIFVATGFAPNWMKDLGKSIFPITNSHWWFISTYFVLYLLSPYLNKLLTQLDKKSYLKLIVLTTICWCVIPTIFNSSFQSNDLIWFIYLYALSGYIRLHFDKNAISSKKCILIALSIVIIVFLTTVIFDIIGLQNQYIGSYYSTYFYGMQTLPILIISLFLFLGFLNLKVKHNKVINAIAAATFGVYLIHDDIYIRNFLWKTERNVMM